MLHLSQNAIQILSEGTDTGLESECPRLKSCSASVTPSTGEQEVMPQVRGLQKVQRQRIQLPVKEMQELWVRALSQEDPLSKERATPSSIPGWKIHRQEGWRLQSIRSQIPGARTQAHTDTHTA